MDSGLDALLWEDLGAIEKHTSHACETLQTITDAIQNGLIGQPSHQDSHRLNRLIVLTELISAEIQTWAKDIKERNAELLRLKDHGKQ